MHFGASRFYNTEKEEEEEAILKLSDSFEDKSVKGDIEVTVRVLNINWGNNIKLMENCKPLSDYSKIVSDVRELVKQGYSMEEAIEIALRILPEDSEVRKLIEENKAGVVDMFLTEYDEQGVMEVFKQEGREEGKEEVAKSMLEDGVSLDKISKYTNIPVEELKKLK